MDKDMYLAYDEWKRKHPDEVGNGSWFAFRAGWQAAKSAQQSFAPDGLTPRQKEEVEQMIESAIIKASS